MLVARADDGSLDAALRALGGCNAAVDAVLADAAWTVLRAPRDASGAASGRASKNTLARLNENSKMYDGGSLFKRDLARRFNPDFAF